MAFIAIEYGLKNIFDDYDLFIFPSNKTQNRDRLHKHHEILRVSNTGSHLLKAQDKLKTFKGVFNYDPVDEK